MKKRYILRLTALSLALTMLWTTGAHALTLEQAAELLQQLYIDEVPAEALEKTTVREMFEAVGDPYTQYFSKEEYEAFMASMSDTSLVGIGVVLLRPADGLIPSPGLHLDQVLQDAPAAKGGLVTGDVILTVDGRPVAGEKLDDVTSWLRGEEGTEVTVTYLHQGVEHTATLIRERVVVAATTTELIEDHIGYIQCTTFGAETAGHFRDGIEQYDSQVDMWIVDLRSNTGGVTDAATQALGCFTGAGYSAILRNGMNEYSAFSSDSDAITMDPIIVLTDPYSASSSEIFAAAAQVHHAGPLIGGRTFGKGVAQIVVDQEYLPDYFPEGDAVKVTAYRFFSPAGNTTDKIGVIPDLLVDPEYALEVASLLSSQQDFTKPQGSYLRLALGGWRWYIDLTKASDEEHREDFQRLLDALPISITVYREDTGSGEWGPVSLADVCTEYGMEYRPATFDDIDDSLFPDTLSILKAYDMIRGRGDGCYYPNEGMTRAELCQLLYSALNCAAPTTVAAYPDVQEGDWFAPAVTALTEMGLFQGEDDGLFHPQRVVDHQQLFTVMGRLAQFLNTQFYNAALNIPEDALEDSTLAAYPEWARTYTWILAGSQTNLFGQRVSLLWDQLSEIAPQEMATRDEAAQLLYTLLSFTDILPY